MAPEILSMIIATLSTGIGLYVGIMIGSGRLERIIDKTFGK